MGINRKSFIRSTLLLLPAIILILAVSIVNGQTSSGAQAQEEVATVVDSSASNAPNSNAPVFREYRGIRIGMTAEEVRAKLEGSKKVLPRIFCFFQSRSLPKSIMTTMAT